MRLTNFAGAGINDRLNSAGVSELGEGFALEAVPSLVWEKMFDFKPSGSLKYAF